MDHEEEHGEDRGRCPGRRPEDEAADEHRREREEDERDHVVRDGVQAEQLEAQRRERDRQRTVERDHDAGAIPRATERVEDLGGGVRTEKMIVVVVEPVVKRSPVDDVGGQCGDAKRDERRTAIN